MCLAIPGKIVSVTQYQDDLFREGKVSFGGIVKEVNLYMVPEAVAGDFVLVHVGVAICKVDAQEAEQTLRYLEQMGEDNELSGQ